MNKWKEKTFIYKLFFTEIWHLILIRSNIFTSDFFNNKTNLLSNRYFIKKIKSQLSFSFFADPFGVFHNGFYYVYFEYLNYRNKKGEIHYHKYNKDLNLIESNIAIKKDFHLSYPYLFKEKDDLYIIPEMIGSKRNQSIFLSKESNLWKEFITNIPSLVDPCLLKRGDNYIILGSIGKKKISYISNGIFNKYQKIDYLSKHKEFQSGGKLLEFNNDIYRPLQISDNTYGEKILLVKLNFKKNSIEESKESVIIDIKDYKGFHTLSTIDDKYTIIDVKKFKFSPLKFIISIQKTLNKKIRKKIKD